MVLSSAILLIYILFAGVSTFGYGVIFSNYIIVDKKLNVGLIGILGFFLLFFISIFLHFFISLNTYLNLGLLFVGFIVGLKNIRLFKTVKNFKFYFITLTLIFLLSAFSSQTYADYEWYHLPYVNYLNSFKIIFGLVNISNNYVYGHGWLDIMGVFNLPIINTNGLTALPIVFYFYFIIFFFLEFYKNKVIFLKIISLFIILISFLIFNRLKDFGADIQPTFTLFIFIFLILKYYFYNNDQLILKLIILLFFYSCVLRIGSVVILPLFLIFFIINIKKYFQDILIKNFRLYTFLFIFFILFISKNFITTGCLFYPIPFTCFNSNSISWANPGENINERYELLSAISKRWKFYSIEEGNLENRYQYYNQIINNTIMSPEEYNSKKLYWLKYFFYDHDYHRFINIVLFALFFSLSLFFISSKNKYPSYNNEIGLNIKLILFGLLFSILFWFFTSPQMRYGGYPIIGTFIIILIGNYLSTRKFEESTLLKLSNLFILFGIIFFGFKNIESSTKDLNNNNFDNFPWPNMSKKIENVDYYSEVYNGVKINFITKNDNSFTGSPRTCGNLSMPCLSSGRKVCISDLYIKSGYIFIINNNSKCLKQFKENYWQH